MTSAFELRLPFQANEQVQDGCVTASARGILGGLDVAFDQDFLPELKRYSLSDVNPENNHMLGVAVVAAERGLGVTVHTQHDLTAAVLPSNVPTKAGEVHPRVVRDLNRLNDQGTLSLETGRLDLAAFRDLVKSRLESGAYCLALLDWSKWNPTAQAKYGNPRHIISIVGLNERDVLAFDPSLDNNSQPFVQPIQKLFDSLTDQQQLIFIGRHTN